VPAVAAWLDSRPALLSLRRALAPAAGPVLSCRSSKGLLQLYDHCMLDAVVVGFRGLEAVDLPALRTRYPEIPTVVYAALRPDHGAMIADLLETGRITGVMVEGVDDPVAGDLVRRHAVSRAREAALADAPRLLRLSEPIQRRAWAHLVRVAGGPIRAAEVAAHLRVSREHLSRQFGAGGAPNLKRVIDLLRVVCAAQLLANPGYDTVAAARVLRFGSPSHLRIMARRIAGARPSDLAGLGPSGVLAGFLRGGTRSRIS
jgi:AraC-like DNA-binding protein